MRSEARPHSATAARRVWRSRFAGPPVGLFLALFVVSLPVVALSPARSSGAARDVYAMGCAFGYVPNPEETPVPSGSPYCPDQPTPVAGLDGAVAVAAGELHSLAVASDGRVWSWGDDTDGQLGDGHPGDEGNPARTFESDPQRVGELTDVKTVAAGSSFSLALAGGKVWSWGANNCGQLGRLTPGPAPVAPDANPAPVPGLEGIVAISAGGAHSLALANDGTVWSWGSNKSGQLGDGTTGAGFWGESRGSDGKPLLPCTNPVPRRVHLPAAAKAAKIAAGGSFSLAIVRSDGDGHEVGTVWGWGSNTDGQLGRPGAGSPSGVEDHVTIPAPIALAPVPVIEISAGLRHSLAIGDDGNLYSWGSNAQGQLGHGLSSPVPMRVALAADVVAASAGRFHSVVLDDDGHMWVWGAQGRDFGQAGPEPNRQPKEIFEQPLGQVDAGTYHTLGAPVDPSPQPTASVDPSPQPTPAGLLPEVTIPPVSPIIDEATRHVPPQPAPSSVPPLFPGDSGDLSDIPNSEEPCGPYGGTCDRFPDYAPVPGRPTGSPAPPGGVFVSGRPSLHQVGRPSPMANAAGARAIIRQAVAFVTGSKIAPKLLLVDDAPSSGDYPNPESAEFGLRQSGFPPCIASLPQTVGCFEVAAVNGPPSGKLDLMDVAFGEYDAVVVSPYLELLEEWFAMGERHQDLIDYVNGGKGLVSFTPSLTQGINVDGCPSDDPRPCPPDSRRPEERNDSPYPGFYEPWLNYLPFLEDHSYWFHPAYEPHPRCHNSRPQLCTDHRLAPEGRAIGLTEADINPGIPIEYIVEACGWDVLEYDGDGRIVSLATKEALPDADSSAGVAECLGMRGDSVSVSEGDTGIVTVSVPITLPRPRPHPVTVEVRTADTTAAAPGDYVAVGARNITFASGETRKTVDVAVRGDEEIEEDEHFALEMKLVGAVLPPARITILNDDRPDDEGNRPKEGDDRPGAGGADIGDTSGVQPALDPINPVSATALGAGPAPVAPATAPVSASASSSATASASSSATASASSSASTAQSAAQAGGIIERERQENLETAGIDGSNSWLASALRPSPNKAAALNATALLLAVCLGRYTGRRARGGSGVKAYADGDSVTTAPTILGCRAIRHVIAIERCRRRR